MSPIGLNFRSPYPRLHIAYLPSSWPLISANTNMLRRLVHAWKAIDIFDGEIRERIHEFYGEIREGIDDLPLATVVRKRGHMLHL